MSASPKLQIVDCGSDFMNNRTSTARRLEEDGILAEDSAAYAEIVARHGIHNIVFSYATGTFMALSAAGEELARGETVSEMLRSLA